jgi:uncharacterized protein with von Willebrand factor type A (vWA) domain
VTDNIHFGKSQQHKDTLLDRLDFNGLVEFSKGNLDWRSLDAFCELTDVEDVSGEWGTIRESKEWSKLQRTFRLGAAERYKAVQTLQQLFDSRDEDEDENAGQLVQQASEEAKQFGEVVRGFGYTESSSPPDTVESVERINRRIPIGLLAKYLGFAERMVSASKKREKADSGRLDSYKPGYLDQSTVSQDILALARGELDAMSRSADGALINKRYSDKQDLGLGNVILLRDESGSMIERMRDGNTRHQHAVALEASLAVELAKKKRKMITYRWSTGHENPRFVWGEGDSAAHLLKFQSGRSTVIQPAMSLAVEETLPDSDIVVITDGKLGSQNVDVPEGTRVWVIIIGGGGDTNIAWADHTVGFGEMGDVEEVIKGVVNRMG